MRKVRKVFNMFRELSMNYVEGYNELTDNLKDLFDSTYKNHLLSIEPNRRHNYSIRNIEKIEGEKYYVNVYYRNGNIFIYLIGNRWVKVNGDYTDYGRSGEMGHLKSIR